MDVAAGGRGSATGQVTRRSIENDEPVVRLAYCFISVATETASP